MSHELEKYYRILGLTSAANLQEVKKQYRKLVFKFHPDKTGGDDRKFIEITDAYDILTGRKSAPKAVTPSRSTSTVAAKTKEDRIKEARKRHYEQTLREHQETEHYFKKLIGGWQWRVVRITAIIGALCSVLLFIEPYLPLHYEKSRLTEFSTELFTVDQEEFVAFAKFSNNQSAFIGPFDFSLYNLYPSGYFQKSWFFHNSLSFVSEQGPFPKEYKIHYSIGKHYKIVAVLLLIPFLTLLYKRKNLYFTILYHVSFYGCTLLLLYFLISNDRWAHLLTLGFL